MALADFTPDTRPILRKGATLFTVRGLNVEDITVLIEQNLADIEKAFTLYLAAKKDIFSTKGMDKFLMLLIQKFPGLVAEVISRSSDEPGTADNARKLPFAIQATALTEIVNLTFEEVGALKNLFATAADKVKSVVNPDVVDGLRSQLQHRLSMSSTGDSEKT